MRMEVKFDYDGDEWQTVNLQRRGRPSRLRDLKLEQCYNGPRPVMRAKLNDVLSLMPYIPPVHHQFYNDIVVDDRSSCQTADDDDDLDLETVQDDDLAGEMAAGSQLNKPKMPKKRKSKKQQI